MIKAIILFTPWIPARILWKTYSMDTYVTLISKVIKKADTPSWLFPSLGWGQYLKTRYYIGTADLMMSIMY